MNRLKPVSHRAPIQWQSWSLHCHACTNVAFDSMQRTSPVLQIPFLVISRSQSSPEYLEFTNSAMFVVQVCLTSGHLLQLSIFTSCLTEFLVFRAHSDDQRHVLPSIVQRWIFLIVFHHSVHSQFELGIGICIGHREDVLHLLLFTVTAVDDFSQMFG